MAKHRLRSARAVIEQNGAGSNRKVRLRLECGHITDWKSVRSGEPLLKRYRCRQCKDEPKSSRIKDK